MKTISFLSFMAILFIAGNVSGQVISLPDASPVLPNERAIPPSPNAAALGKYGQYPVNLNTGVPDITIPIYTIKGRQLELPISLSYHASGIKVNEIASWAGLGWTLNAGGAISITARGKGDLSASSNKRYNEARTAGQINNSADNNNLAYILKNMHRGDFDTESDLYFYNITGLGSGTFTYNHRNEVVELPNTDYKIIIRKLSELNPRYEAIITADNGIQYVFSNEHTEQTSELPDFIGGGSTFFSAFNLSKIISADGKDQITFVYKKYTGVYDEYISYSAWKGYSHPDDYVTSNANGCLVGGGHSLEGNRSRYTYEEQILDRIEFSNGKVVFEDGLRTGKRNHNVKSIKVYNNVSSTPVFTVGFTYSDFDSNTSSGQADKRLKLEKIEFYPESTEKQTYSFDYNPEKLPPYYSYTGMSYEGSHKYNGQDEWGYYNGVVTNTHLLSTSDPCWMGLGWFTPANRLPNEQYTKACILEKITFPTGGYTRFNYELNRGENNIAAGGLRVKDISSFDTNGTLLEQKQYTYKPGHIISPPDKEIRSYSQGYAMIYLEIIGSPRRGGERQFLQATPVAPQGLSGGNSVFYEHVTEYFGNAQGVSNGKKEYHYQYVPNVEYGVNAHWHGSSTPDPVINSGITPFTKPRYANYIINNSWKRGQLLEETTYKKKALDYEPVQKITNTYQELRSTLDTIGTVVSRIYMYPEQSPIGPDIYKTDKKAEYFFFDILASTGVVKQTSTTLTEYQNGQPVLNNTVTYQYDKALASNNAHLQVTSSKTFRSNGDEIITKFKYPFDFEDKAIGVDGIQNTLLKNANMRTVPIEIVQYLKKSGGNELAMAGVFYRYSGYRPTEIYQLFSNTPFSYSGATLNNTGFQISPNYQKVGTASYNSYNLLSSYISKDGAKEEYNWDATYHYISTASKYIQPNELLVNNTLTTTYTYQPLVGLTSSSDYNGITTHYVYDAQNRLTTVKDHNQHMVTRYNYNYATNNNQPAPVTSAVQLNMSSNHGINTLSWTLDVPTLGVSYEIKYGTSDQYTSSPVYTSILYSGTAESYTHTPNYNNTTTCLYYQVVAKKNGSVIAYSNPVYTTLSEESFAPVLSIVPGRFGMNPSLSWTTRTGYTYEVQYTQESNPGAYQTLVSNITTGSYTPTLVGGNYTMRVVGHKDQYTIVSNEVNFIVEELLVQRFPVTLTKTGTNTVSLSWDISLIQHLLPQGVAITYTIMRAEYHNSPLVLFLESNIIGETLLTNYTDTNIPLNKNYVYLIEVRASWKKANSCMSTPVQIGTANTILDPGIICP